MDWKATGDTPGAWHLTDDLQAEHGKGDPFAAAIRATRMSMIITNPRLEDNPIVFVNDAFLRLTGYQRDEVIGRNCRFLQGKDTDPAVIDSLRWAIEGRKDINVDVLNYRKDGSAFWNALYLSPVVNEAGELQFFFASQMDITEHKEAERLATNEKKRFEQAVHDRTAELEAALEAKTALLHEVDHRVKNNLQMVSSLIVMQARTIPDDEIRRSLQAMLTRVEALSTLHRRLYESDDVSRFQVAGFLKDLVTDLVAASPLENVEMQFDLQDIDVTAGRAAPIALIVNELVTNALKHALVGQPKPVLTVRLTDDGSTFCIDVEDNGNGIEGEPRDASFGMKLIRSLCRQLKAEVVWHPANPGTRARICLPNDGVTHAPGKNNNETVEGDYRRG